MALRLPLCRKGAEVTVSIHINQTMTGIEGIASAQIGRISPRKKSVEEQMPQKLLICIGMPAGEWYFVVYNNC